MSRRREVKFQAARKWLRDLYLDGSFMSFNGWQPKGLDHRRRAPGAHRCQGGWLGRRAGRQSRRRRARTAAALCRSPAAGSLFDAPVVDGNFMSDYAISELQRLQSGDKPW